MARKKNPSVVGTLVGVAVVGGLGYLVYNEVKENKAKKAGKKDSNVINEKGAINIEKAMPKSTDFPMGWVVEDSGMESNDTGILVYRLLKLNSPSSLCSPDPCTYVLVFVGQRANRADTTRGWSAHPTQESAYDALVQRVDAMTK